MGTQRLEIDVPDDLLTGIDAEQLKSLAREAPFVKLYERGLLSSGRAADLLEITRWDFLDLFGRYGVSYVDGNIDFEEALRNARP